MLTELGRRMDEYSENLKQQKTWLSTEQKSELKNTLTKGKNILEGFNRLDKAEEWLSELQDKAMECRTRKNNLKKKINLGGLFNNIR